MESKPSCPPEGNELKNLTGEKKGQSPKSDKYTGDNTITISQGTDPEDKNNFKGSCNDLEGYIFALRPRASDKFVIAMKEL